MQRNQINLGNWSLDANKAFLTALYNTDQLTNMSKHFDQLNCSVSVARQDDPTMTLDEFLTLMNPSFYIRLQIGSPFPENIRYCASGKAFGVDKFAWIEAPFTPSNYRVVSELFREVYAQDIESVSVPNQFRR